MPRLDHEHCPEILRNPSLVASLRDRGAWHWPTWDDPERGWEPAITQLPASSRRRHRPHRHGLPSTVLGVLALSCAPTEDPVTRIHQCVDDPVGGTAGAPAVPSPPRSANVRLNEIKVDPPGTDGNQEFVELRGDPGSSTTGLALLTFEGDTGTTLGQLDDMIDVANLCANPPCLFGTDGLLLLAAPDGVTLPAQSQSGFATTQVLSGGGLENGTTTLLLVWGADSMATRTDYDGNDDGLLELPLAVTVEDAVAWTDGNAGDLGYAPVTLGKKPRVHAAWRCEEGWRYGQVAGDQADSLQIDAPANAFPADLPALVSLTPGLANDCGSPSTPSQGGSQAGGGSDDRGGNPGIPDGGTGTVEFGGGAGGASVAGASTTTTGGVGGLLLGEAGLVNGGGNPPETGGYQDASAGSALGGASALAGSGGSNGGSAGVELLGGAPTGPGGSYAYPEPIGGTPAAAGSTQAIPAGGETSDPTGGANGDASNSGGSFYTYPPPRGGAPPTEEAGQGNLALAGSAQPDTADEPSAGSSGATENTTSAGTEDAGAASETAPSNGTVTTRAGNDSFWAPEPFGPDGGRTSHGAPTADEGGNGGAAGQDAEQPARPTTSGCTLVPQPARPIPRTWMLTLGLVLCWGLRRRWA